MSTGFHFGIHIAEVTFILCNGGEVSERGVEAENCVLAPTRNESFVGEILKITADEAGAFVGALRKIDSPRRSVNARNVALPIVRQPVGMVSRTTGAIQYLRSFLKLRNDPAYEIHLHLRHSPCPLTLLRIVVLLLSVPRIYRAMPTLWRGRFTHVCVMHVCSFSSHLPLFLENPKRRLQHRIRIQGNRINPLFDEKLREVGEV